MQVYHISAVDYLERTSEKLSHVRKLFYFDARCIPNVSQLIPRTPQGTYFLQFRFERSFCVIFFSDVRTASGTTTTDINGATTS